ncbi:MAG TPA: hypothetical protein PKL31_01450 [Fulvivirga sp.]|nr:hypothetical protein [Fulvivirga sp.]
MSYEDNPKSIKYYVKRFIQREASQFKDKVVVEFEKEMNFDEVSAELKGVHKEFGTT